MQSNVGGEGTQAEEPQESTVPPDGTGQGAATALARLKSQREHIARQQPADDPTHGSRRNDSQG